MLKYDKRDFASPVVLLVMDFFVRRHQDFETSLLGDIDQLAIREFFPAP